MSDAEEAGRLRGTLDTATPPYSGHPDAQMDAIGVAVALGVLVVLVPLLPFALIVLVVLKLLDAVADRRGGPRA